MAYIVYKDNSSYYVFAQLIGTASSINPNRILENQPSYVISAIKEQVRLASTANVTLPGPVTIIDGTSLNNGDRVLLVGQSTASENGIYFWDSATQFLLRSQDFFDVRSGLLVVVEEGLLGADSLWILTTDNPIEVNVTPLTFSNVTGGGPHAPTHIYAAADEIDADRLGIDLVPLHYVRDTTGPLVSDVHHLTAHLQGIDLAIGGLVYPVSTAIARVDPTSSDAVDDNDLTTAFVTIQGAVNAIPPIINGIVEIIYPGPYDETVYIRRTGISLVGKSSQSELSGATSNITTIAPVTGPAIVISDATSASLTAWIGAGYALYNATYGSLVNDPGAGVVSSFLAKDLCLNPLSDEYAVVVAGTTDTTNMGLIGFQFDNCRMLPSTNRGIWARLACRLFLLSDTQVDGDVYTFNIAQISSIDSRIKQITQHYDVAEFEPSETQVGWQGDPVIYDNIGPAIQMTGSALSGNPSGIYDFYPHVEQDIDLKDTSVLYLRGGEITGDITIAQDAYIDFEHVGVTGDITCATGGGDPACNMSGGGYLGSLTDPGNRFIYTPYRSLQGPQNIPLAINEVCDGVTSLIQVGQFMFDPTNYSTNCTYQFEVILSVSNGILTGTASLYNLTDLEAVTGTSLATSNTTPTNLNSGNLTVGAAAGNLKNSQKMYEVRLQNNGAALTDLTFLGSARLLIFS